MCGPFVWRRLRGSITARYRHGSLKTSRRGGAVLRDGARGRAEMRVGASPCRIDVLNDVVLRRRGLACMKAPKNRASRRGFLYRLPPARQEQPGPTRGSRRYFGGCATVRAGSARPFQPMLMRCGTACFAGPGRATAVAAAVTTALLALIIALWLREAGLERCDSAWCVANAATDFVYSFSPSRAGEPVATRTAQPHLMQRRMCARRSWHHGPS